MHKTTKLTADTSDPFFDVMHLPPRGTQAHGKEMFTASALTNLTQKEYGVGESIWMKHFRRKIKKCDGWN